MFQSRCHVEAPCTVGFAHLIIVGHPLSPAEFQREPPRRQAHIVGCIAVLNRIHPCELHCRVIKTTVSA